MKEFQDAVEGSLYVVQLGGARFGLGRALLRRRRGGGWTSRLKLKLEFNSSK